MEKEVREYTPVEAEESRRRG